MPIVLLYHDVVTEDDASGFPGGGAAQYKLRPEEFDAHLAAIASAAGAPACLLEAAGAESPVLTFDDGGVSAITHIAPALERRGWQGHFLVTAGYIGSHGFLDAGGVRELVRRGHSVGSHSYSHPTRMAACSRSELLEEWRRSLEFLSEIVGARVDTASVPGGYYSRAVAETASEAGIRTLFNSEPTMRVVEVDACRVFGRYTIYRGMSPGDAGRLASGSRGALLRQSVVWNLKKLLKAAGGRSYVELRGALLNRRHASSTGEERPE